MKIKRETELYAPVKAYLEGQGYTVKGEVGAADVVARRGEEDPVIVELKRGFSLALYHQALERLLVSDTVYIAVPRPKGRMARGAIRANTRMCRRLGLGLILVREKDGFVEVACDPGPYAPRKSKRKSERLLRAFERLEGDPNTGGAQVGQVITGYRQDAMKCAAFLAEHGPSRGRDVATCGVTTATRIMYDNHYGWFERVETGVYGLTEKGRAAL